MNKRTLPLLLTLTGCLITLSACIPDFKAHLKNEPTSSTTKKKNSKRSSTTSSKSIPSSASPSTEPSSKSLTTDGLPKNAHEAPKDKIYATGNSKVVYSKNKDEIIVQTPDYEGYTTTLVRTILGEPEEQRTDPSYMAKSFVNTELENIKKLKQESKLTKEQAQAFLTGAADLKQASQMGANYTIYTYQNKSIQLVFEKDKLLYITPNPDVVFFK